MKGRTDKAGADTIARLILPTVNAWIDIGAREKFPERHLLAVNSPTRPEPALSLQVALIQIAAKRADSAAALTDNITLTDRTSQLVATRVAATLDKAGESEAAGLLRGRIALARSAERRVGKEWVSTCISRWAPDH